MQNEGQSGIRRRAVIYCRISDDREGRREGVDRQEKACRQRAARLGWNVVEVLIDNDISAYSGKRRPQYERMLDMLRSGEADAVLALTSRRLQRNWRDAFDFLDLVEQKGIAVELVKSGTVNLSTADGRREARRKAVDDQHESEEIGERVRDAKAEAATQGIYRGGPRPFGYEADGITVREGEARWIRYATKAIIDGESLRSICRTLAREGVRTVPRRKRLSDGTRTDPIARDWKGEELRKMLLRARNAGLLEVSVKDKDGKKRYEIAGPAVWPPVLDGDRAKAEEMWRACKAVLENPARRTTTGNGRVWLLSGLARCWCGSTVRGSTTGVGGVKKVRDGGKTYRPAYRCYAVPTHVIRDAHQLDQHIEDLARARLARPDAAELHLKQVLEAEPREDLASQGQMLRIKLDSIAADYTQDLITREQMLEMTAGTRERLNAVTAKMAGRASTSVIAALPLGDPEAIAEMWQTLHLDRRRQVVDALMTIVIGKARKGRPPGFRPGIDKSYFDPESIAIDWKPPT
ncbi:recombinase family protein [Streptomyces sp. NPDC101225]|uniref:recombinase family protein n=1 Tax=Streptomyces sp. NPDC101225 TaxID=3366135 RepID=UPI003827C947